MIRSHYVELDKRKRSNFGNHLNFTAEWLSLDSLLLLDVVTVCPKNNFQPFIQTIIYRLSFLREFIRQRCVADGLQKFKWNDS